MLLRCTETTPSMGRRPYKKRKQPDIVVASNDEMSMTDDNLKAMSVPPERPAGESSAVVPFAGRPGYHAYECWCDACLSTMVTTWKEVHPDKTMLPDKRPAKPVVPFV